MPLLGDRAVQVVDLRPVEQQPAPAHGVLVPAIALLVGRNVELADHGLLPLHRGVGLGQARLAGAQALHLGAGQHQPGLNGLEDGVVVPRASIVRDDPLGRLVLFGHDS